MISSVRNIAELVTVVSALMLMPACSTQSQQQREVAMKAVYKLRDNFNNGSCQEIAANADADSDLKRKEWLDECEHLRTVLQRWNSLAYSKSTSLAPFGSIGTVRVEGLAKFGANNHTETYWLEAYWHVRAGRAYMYFLHLAGGENEISLPHSLKPARQKLDIPPSNPVG